MIRLWCSSKTRVTLATPIPYPIERMEKLVNVVYTKIITLDLPDISKYSQDINGILEFEDDLLKITE